MVGEHKHRMPERRLVAPPPVRPRVVLPRALAAAEHPPAHDCSAPRPAMCSRDRSRSSTFASPPSRTVRFAPRLRCRRPTRAASRRRAPSGSSRVWFGPATKPSRDTEISTLTFDMQGETFGRGQNHRSTRRLKTRQPGAWTTHGYLAPFPRRPPLTRDRRPRRLCRAPRRLGPSADREPDHVGRGRADRDRHRPGAARGEPRQRDRGLARRTPPTGSWARSTTCSSPTATSCAWRSTGAWPR